MKPLPPSQVIAEYQRARERCGLEPADIKYARGWFVLRQIFAVRYRGAQIIHMTATLNERAKAKG